ncbi:MAG: hypothetical protein U0R44_04915 [Candidatus Micrarchaeia archaeon]
MTLNSRMRNLAFAGALATTACAGTQHPTADPQRIRMQPTVAANPLQDCLGRRSRRQECMIEGIAAQCTGRASGNQDAFVSCMGQGLAISETPAARTASVTVSAGDEVLSMRVGAFTIMDVYRLDVSAVDQNGIAFTFDIERLSTSAPTERTQVSHSELRMNFDGTKTGPWAVVSDVIEAWNFRVEAVDATHARVRFETDDPRLLVRTSQ